MRHLIATLGCALALAAGPAAAATSVELGFPNPGGEFYTGGEIGELDDGVDTGLFTDTSHWLEMRYFQVAIPLGSFTYVLPVRTEGLTEDAVFELVLNGVAIHDIIVHATAVDGYSTLTGGGAIDPATSFPSTGYDGQILRLRLKQNMSPGAGGVAFGPNGTLTFHESAVPEPATWALMIVGFGLAGATVRRRSCAHSPARPLRPVSAVRNAGSR